MNNTYASSNLPQQQQQTQHHQNSQQHQAQAQSIAYLPAHAHMPHQQQHQQHIQRPLHEELAGTATYFDARALEKSLSNYVGAAANRYFTNTTSNLSNLPTPHNTILITNNFAQQALPQTLAGNSNNIRFLTNSNNNNNTATGCGIYNLSKDSTGDAAATLHLPHAHLYQQHQTQLPQHQALAQFTTHLPNLQQQQFQQHFANLAVQQQQQINQATMQLPPYFMNTTEAVATTESSKTFPALLNTSDPICLTTTTTTTTPSASITTTPNNSTVVLDRINICINNHYTDANNSINPTNSSSSLDTPLTPLTCTTTTTDKLQQQQPSPVIPAIQHKISLLTDIGETLLNESSIKNNDNHNICINVIDEPDSTTTTSHTPPTTPNNATTEQANIMNSPIHQSPSTTTTNIMHETSDIVTCDTPVEEDEEEETEALANDTLNNTNETADVNTTTTTKSTTIVVIDLEDKDEEEIDDNEEIEETELIQEQQQQELPAFKVGEDILLKRQDNRFYLGTVINCGEQQYLVQFDDKSEQWCYAEEMRKLGGGTTCVDSSDGEQKCDSGNNALQGEHNGAQTQMCVACKRRQANDVVECCERCGRGYHRGCTTEVFPGSGDYICKRCAKPMKVQKSIELDQEGTTLKTTSVCRQLPYHVDSLSWDEKHRVNEEQIYCYCGKTGKFDHNMLQCCKCKNWFHTQCMQNFKTKLFRGDW